MSDVTPTPGWEEHDRRPQRPAPVAVLAGFPFTLVISFLVSVILVVIVGLLIAIMQYQARLLRAQPLLSAAQVRLYADTEKLIAAKFSSLAELSRRMSEAASEYFRTEAEIAFRVERICVLFRESPEDFTRCKDFLNRIPFAGTTREQFAQADTDGKAGSIVLDTAKRVSGPFNVRPISSELMKSIQAQFIETLGGADRMIGRTRLPEVVPLYTWDMEEIARLNVAFWLNLSPPYQFMLQQYRSTCEYIRELARVLSAYRTIDASICAEFLAKVPASKPSADTIPVGGMPIGAAFQLQSAPADGAGTTPNEESAPPANAIRANEGSNAPTDAPPERYIGTLSTANRLDQPLLFELVNNYVFYERMLGRRLATILLSPSEFLALALVCFGGILGSLLRVVFFAYTSGKDPGPRNLFIGPILGLICALVVYILFRAGFIALTDRGQSSETAVLSPFVIAILSVAAGLLSERSIELFRRTSGTWLGSIEASQSGRWAVHLGPVLKEQKMKPESLAARLDLSADKLKDWIAEKDVVPIEKQREISLVLNVPIRTIFTDLPPPQKS